jgi:integrase
LDLSKPIGEWKKAWRLACENAGVKYPWHDQRHSFISRIAENPQVSEETIRALAGHVSKQMLQRYSHIRSEAKRAAIEGLERDHLASGVTAAEIDEVGAQNGAQSDVPYKPMLN